MGVSHYGKVFDTETAQLDRSHHLRPCHKAFASMDGVGACPNESLVILVNHLPDPQGNFDSNGEMQRDGGKCHLCLGGTTNV
jgi:hypothetical protein